MSEGLAAITTRISDKAGDDGVVPEAGHGQVLRIWVQIMTKWMPVDDTPGTHVDAERLQEGFNVPSEVIEYIASRIPAGKNSAGQCSSHAQRLRQPSASPESEPAA